MRRSALLGALLLAAAAVVPTRAVAATEDGVVVGSRPGLSLGGAGWYYTHISDESPYGDRSDHRFGPHAGAGLQVWFNKYWSIDGSYRYVWLSAYRSRDAAHPVGRDIRDQGWMATAALNYHLF